MEHLGFRCFGVFASWGDIAVGVHRPSWSWPTRSALLGLTAAALGIPRDRDRELGELAEQIGVAVGIEASGRKLSDYHTAQVPPRAARWQHGAWRTRWDELHSGELQTILSTRELLTDAVYTAVLWWRGERPADQLDKIANALKMPAFHLYLGRKSNPLGMPAFPQRVDADTLRGVFQVLAFPDSEFIGALHGDQPTEIRWDADHPASGFDPARVTEFHRRDVPTSRRGWQFAVRAERAAILNDAEQEA